MFTENFPAFDWLYLFSIAFLGLYLTFLFIGHLPAIYASCALLYKNSKKDLVDSYPPVSIIKPLAGTDPNLKINLETYFNLKYPKYEIIFCVQSEDDPCLQVVRELKNQYPLVDMLVFTGAKNDVVNPKINNMLQGYDAVKYDHLWMSDANIMATPDTLAEMVTCIESTPRVGLVHQVPFWASRPDFASCVNQVYFGSQHARIYLASYVMYQICASGMSFLMRKSVLEEVGGLKHFGQYLAEDFFLANNLKSKGYNIVLSSLPAIQNPGAYSISMFRNRLARWIKLRTAMIPFPTLLEPLTDCFLTGLLVSLSFHYVTGVSFVLCFFVHIAMWMSSDYILLRGLQNGPLFHWKQLFIAWWVRELLALPIFIQGVISRRVKWKDREFQLQWGGNVKETTPIAKPVLSV